jgi:hypothetical protein
LHDRRLRIVLITSAAPYLGGPQTWAPLRNAAPEFDFTELDPFFVGVAVDLERAVHDILAAAICDADAIVAHSGAARAALEAVARERPDLPVMLLSPFILGRPATLFRLVRTVFGRPPLSWVLDAFARSKHRRLRSDRSYVVKQLAFFVAPNGMSEALVDEAQERIRDPRTDRIVERTSEFFRYALTPLDVDSEKAVCNRVVLSGTGPLDRLTAKWMAATILESVTGAPMLEAPDAVAQALRDLVTHTA